MSKTECCNARQTTECNSTLQKAQLSATCGGETTTKICCDKIRERAYYKWEQAGYPEGDGSNFWIEAETELRNELTV